MRIAEGGGPQFDLVAMDTCVDISKLVKLFAMTPATSAVRRIKAFLRFTMSQERLNHYYLAHS